ncbi:Disease resistance protein RPM1 [Camellia lanceoleosa]|uniref:Disease resistance protein RPM1 n=1 Tax=Camellia lanceoleosa TaxID=1840588 RepID=A0ACC0HD98_9ERIC|nr:Disease resistance protein RPM1 [Camellia lanceoleosa]
MAETAVFHLLANFAPFLQQEANLLIGVREEIEYIRDEFDRMTAFIRVADAMEENNPELKVWVKQVREAAYDIGDVLELYMLRLGHCHGAGFRGFLRKVSCFIKTLKARHQIASEVQRMKSRVIDISKGHQRYHDRYGTLERGSSSRSSCLNTACHDYRGDALLLDESELVGIDKPKSQLIRWLVHEDPRLKVFSVSGMGGLGKTTLVKKVFDDAVVNNHFQSHVWITVSESFKIEVLLKGIIKQLFEEIKQPVPQGMDNMDTNSLKGIINAFLQQKRYVLVFDDVWDIHAWQSFRYVFPIGNCGSRVVLTTRNADLASIASTEYYGVVYNLQPLPPEESWTLFCTKTFMENSCPSHLERLSKAILNRCGGLPLAIVAISGLLSTKDKSSVDEWDKIYRSLGAELQGNDKLLSMNKILSLSYIDLPYYLKFCFLYLSVFPEDCLIDHWRLIRLWVAEGFVESKAGMTIEEVAEGYLNELINRSLVQVAEMRNDGRVQKYRIHDLWREIIVSKSGEQNIVTLAGEQSRVWPEKVRRLSINNHWKYTQQTKRFTRLRSLLMFNATDSMSKFSMLASSNHGLQLLTVLDLKGALLETFPNEVLKLIQLRYLSLRRTNVKVIPKSIGKLQNLETLDLKDTYVTELPDDILKLQQLRHILLYRYKKDFVPGICFQHNYGFKAPTEIGSLSSLQKLCSIEANHDNGTILLGEVGKLTQLRKLRIEKLRNEDGRVLCSSLEKLSNLRSLFVRATGEDKIIDLDSLSSPPQLLRTLCLVGTLLKVPHWIPSLHSLARLHLEWSKLRDVDPLESLQDLPNLVELRLLQTYEGAELCFKAGGFQRLVMLYLRGLKGLRWVKVEAGSMPHLEELIIQKCELEEELPSGIEHLTNLKSLDLVDMSDGLISSLNRDLEREYNWKIAHIPKVWIGDTKLGYWKRKFSVVREDV